MIAIARRVEEDVRGLVKALRAARGPGVRKRRQLVERVQHFLELLGRILDQTERRVFGGETVPVAEKVFSVFEEHVDLLVSGRTPTAGGPL